MNTWDFGGSSSKTEYTKFPVGITHIRVIDDVPFVRWTHWIPKFSKSVNCPGQSCPICDIRKKQKAAGLDYTYGVSRRIAMNIINRETGKIEIMEQGITFFNDLRDLMVDLKEQGLKLSDVDIKVRRRGQGKDDTSYRLDIDKEYPLSDSELELIKTKPDLSTHFKPHTIEQLQRLINGESWDDIFAKSEETDKELVEIK